jgi:hypothetical protein
LNAVVLGLLVLLLHPSGASANWPYNSNVNVPVCTAPGDQTYAWGMSDGNGGAFVVWYDMRNSNLGGGGSGIDIYVQHVFGSGLVDAGWPVNGLAICTAVGDQMVAPMVSDGAGGAIISWTDQRNEGTPGGDIYAQRFSAAGVTLWAPNGVPVCTAAGQQTNPWLTMDGTGGAIIAWQDRRSGESHIYAQRISGTGAAQWAAGGVPVCTVAGNEIFPEIVGDGVGGAIATW